MLLWCRTPSLRPDGTLAVFGYADLIVLSREFGGRRG
jgi:hypothetical protein